MELLHEQNLNVTFCLPESKENIIYDVEQKGFKQNSAFFISKIKKERTVNSNIFTSFSEQNKIGRSEKPDLLFNFGEDNETIAVATRYKKRYKYLTADQLASLLVSFMIETNLLNSCSKISASKMAGTLPLIIASKTGIEIVEDVEESTLYFDENGAIIINGVPDELGVVSLILKMVSHYKFKGSCLYDELISIYSSFGIHRYVTFHQKTSPASCNHLIKSLKTSKVIISKKRESFNKISKNEYLVKFADGSWLGVKIVSDGMVVFSENIKKGTDDYLEVAAYEKQLNEFIRENTEEIKSKSFSLKGFFKYSLFTLLLVLTMYAVFELVYKGATTNSGKTINTFSVATHIFDYKERYIWLFWWFGKSFLVFISAFKKKRMFDFLGEKVKVRHIVISATMSSFIAFITPFAVGGDAIGYWYLRRKNVDRSKLLAVLTTNTILGELKYTLQTVFLFAIGYSFYAKIFSASDPQSTAALLWFFVGMGWSVFSTFMILILTMSRKFQEFIVRNSIVFLEWFRFTNVYDPVGKVSQYQYQFKSMRDGMKKMWTSWKFGLEMIIFTVGPLFFSPVAIYYSVIGVVNPNLQAGSYMTQIVARDIIGTANSMSITPGGHGTGEWLAIQINKHIYKGGEFQSATGFSSEAIASGGDLLNKILFDWPWLLLSSSIILGALLREKMHDKNKIIGKTNTIHNKNENTKKYAKYIIHVIVITFTVAYLLFYFFI